MRSLEHCGPSLDGLTESTSSMRSRWIRILLREIFRNLVPGVAAQFNPGPGFRVMNGAPGPLLAAAFPRRASGSESKAPPDSEAACHWQWARAAPAGRPRARSRPESGVTRRPGPHAISVAVPATPPAGHLPPRAGPEDQSPRFRSGGAASSWGHCARRATRPLRRPRLRVRVGPLRVVHSVTDLAAPACQWAVRARLGRNAGGCDVNGASRSEEA
jgi:hypothetical protein